jgi:hypothetical protein
MRKNNAYARKYLFPADKWKDVFSVAEGDEVDGVN